MGRKRKYFTKEEKIQANRDNFMRFYWKNKEKIKQYNKEYWTKYYIPKNKFDKVKRFYLKKLLKHPDFLKTE